MPPPENEDLPVKTPKQLEKEAKKLAKLDKFKQKQDSIQQKGDQPKEKIEVCGRLGLEFNLLLCEILFFYK